MTQLYYKKINYSPYKNRIPLQIIKTKTKLSTKKKTFLNTIKKKNYTTIKQTLQKTEIYYNININYINPLNKNALLITIKNKNLKIIKLLLNHNIYINDTLLYAIRKKIIKTIKLLLNYKKPNKKKQIKKLPNTKNN